MNVPALLWPAPVVFPARDIQILAFNMQRSWTICLTGQLKFDIAEAGIFFVVLINYEMLEKWSVQSNITFHYCYELLYYSSALQTVSLHFFRLFPVAELFFTSWAIQVCCCRLNYIYSFLSEITWTYSRVGCAQNKENNISSFFKFRAQSLLLLSVHLTRKLCNVVHFVQVFLQPCLFMILIFTPYLHFCLRLVC